jgi:hypothetical protein
LKDGISPGIAGPTQANPIFVVFEEEEAMAKTEKGDAGVAIVQNGAAMTVRTRGTINKRQVGDIVSGRDDRRHQGNDWPRILSWMTPSCSAATRLLDYRRHLHQLGSYGFEHVSSSATALPPSGNR